MDYTTVALVKAASKIQKAVDDPLIQRFVTAASRATDVYCTRSQSPEAIDYFRLETVTAQMLRGIADRDGSILFYPRKSNVIAVSAMEWRTSPITGWRTVDPSRIEIIGRNEVKAWTLLEGSLRGDITVRVTYRGGLAEDTASLPADFVEAVTLLATRFYREDESGVTDAIGLAEIGTFQYTKALPQRYKEFMLPYQRAVRW